MYWESFVERFDLIQILFGLIIASVIAIISYRLRALSLSGVIGMITVGSIIFGLGGMIFAVPLVFFFVSSSLLSFVKSYRKELSKIAFDKTGPRDIYQVLANGGVSTIAVLLYFITGNMFWFFPYLAGLCEAAADTWATELGTLSKTDPVSILTFKKVAPGQSGGVTLLGILASLAGSFAVMGVGYGAVLFYGENILLSSIGLFFACANAGFVGALFDSVLGGSLQSQYKCAVCEKAIESKNHCGLPSEHISGLCFMNNDMVNFLATFVAGIVIAIFVF